MKNNILTMTLTLVIIAVVVSVAMSYVNGITSPLIAENAEKKLTESRKKVIDADNFPIIKEEEDYTVFEAFKDGERVGFCVQNKTPGYGGDITVLTGVDNNYTVTGIALLSHTETAGLGAKADEDKFKNQFIGKSENVDVAKNNPKENEIEAITGATITSKAVTKAVKEAIKLVKEAGINE